MVVRVKTDSNVVQSATPESNCSKDKKKNTPTCTLIVRLFVVVCIAVAYSGYEIFESVATVISVSGSSNNAPVAMKQQQQALEKGGNDDPDSSAPLLPDITLPFKNRWQQRFYFKNHQNHSVRSIGRNYLFFKHIRKAGGTSMRKYLFDAIQDHQETMQRQTFLEEHPVHSGNVSRRFQFFVHNNPNAKLLQLQPFYLEKEKAVILDFVSRSSNVTEHPRTMKVRNSEDYQEVHYAEQEFTSMDSMCFKVDPKWNTSLSVIVVRHPIERLFSDMFYSSRQRWEIKKKIKLYRQSHINQTSVHEFIAFIKPVIMTFLNVTHMAPNNNRIFGRFYSNNFQLRALAGCSDSSPDGSCIKENYNGTISIDYKRKIAETKSASLKIPITESNATTASTCTIQPFYEQTPRCNFNARKTCPYGCEGPCSYLNAAWKPKLNRHDLHNAITALSNFDVVLLTETLDEWDQGIMLSDVLGLPSDRKIPTENTNIKKGAEKRAQTHYYRDLLSDLSTKSTELKSILDDLYKQNELEIELYEYAVQLNKHMTDLWKKETNYNCSESQEEGRRG